MLDRWPPSFGRQLHSLGQSIRGNPSALHFGKPAKSVLVGVSDNETSGWPDMRLNPIENATRLLGSPRGVNDNRTLRTPDNQSVGGNVPRSWHL